MPSPFFFFFFGFWTKENVKMLCVGLPNLSSACKGHILMM